MGADLPAVSVVVPAFNAERYIAEALDSVLGQNITGLEVVVVDDGSSDRTSAIVEAYGPPVRVIRRNSSGGFPGVVRDAGIAVSRAPLIAFLDADDVMSPGRLRGQMREFARQPEVGLVFSNYCNFTNEGEESSHFSQCRRLAQRLQGCDSVVLDCPLATRLLLRENFGIPSSAMIRRSVLQEVPGFQGQLATSEDFVFFYRIARKFKVMALAQVGARRRVHGSNTTGNVMRVLENYVYSRRLLLNEEGTGPNRTDLENIVCDRELDLAREYANRRLFRAAWALTGIATGRSVSLRSWSHMKSAMRVGARTMAIASRLRAPGA